MKVVTLGQNVIVYDRYRFAIPLKAIVVELSKTNDGVRLQLTTSNSVDYPVGCDTVWVSIRQLRKDKKDRVMSYLDDHDEEVKNASYYRREMKKLQAELTELRQFKESVIKLQPVAWCIRYDDPHFKKVILSNVSRDEHSTDLVIYASAYNLLKIKLYDLQEIK